MALPSRGWAETEHSVTCNLLPRNCYCYLPSRQIAKALYDEDSSVNDCHRERVPTPPGSEVVGGRAHLLGFTPVSDRRNCVVETKTYTIFTNQHV